MRLFVDNLLEPHDRFVIVTGAKEYYTIDEKVAMESPP
jgi:hypothetical protein